MLNWFHAKGDIDTLIARKQYSKALRLLEHRLDEDPDNIRTRQQLADVLGRRGDTERAVEVLLPVVDVYANQGFQAKAIAVLKKIERLAPEKHNMVQKLAMMLERKETRPSSVPLIRAHVDSAMERAPIGANQMITSEVRPPDEWFEQAVDQGSDFQWSPILEDFTKDELATLIGGLKLLVKMPGAIIFGEGEPGDSVFILASGQVRVYRRNDVGLQLQLTVLREGDLFGEASLLFDSPRTTTVTAAARCELLELDRENFDRITRTSPRVRERLERLYEKRCARGLELPPQTEARN